MPLIPLTDLNDPRLDPYRNLKLTNQTRTTGHLIAEGHRVVRRLVDSDFAVESIVVSERRKHTIDDINPDRYQIFVIPEEVGTQLVGFEFHAGVLAAGKRRESPSISEWLPRNATGNELVVVCPRITVCTSSFSSWNIRYWASSPSLLSAWAAGNPAISPAQITAMSLMLFLFMAETP